MHYDLDISSLFYCPIFITPVIFFFIGNKKHFESWKLSQLLKSFQFFKLNKRHVCNHGTGKPEISKLLTEYYLKTNRSLTASSKQLIGKVTCLLRMTGSAAIYLIREPNEENKNFLSRASQLILGSHCHWFVSMFFVSRDID